MEFSLRKVGDAHMKLYESDIDSSVQLVFLPSGLNPELWENQIRYFSKKFKTTTFRPMESQRDRKGEMKCLENILDSEDYTNTVIISHNFGNSLLRDIEPHENVLGTVATGMFRGKIAKPPRLVYRMGWKTLESAPKLASKIFFSDLTDYSVVKEFSKTVERPKYADFKSFVEGYRLEKPVRDSMFVYADEDRFSDLSHVKNMEKAGVSVVENAGSFSFWEKPQEFNKALDDHLRRLVDFVEARELVRLKKENKSLRDFEKDENEMRRRIENRVKIDQ